MSKKILLISQNFYPEIGSAGNRMKNIYIMLKKEGYEIDVLTTDPTYPNRKFYEDPSFWDDQQLNETRDVTRVKIRNRKYSRSFMNRLLYYLEMAVKMIGIVLGRSEKYDYVYTTSPPIFVAAVGLIAKIRFKAKLILEIRDLWPDSLKGVGVFNYPFIIGLFRKIEKVLYKRADEIIVNSKGFISHIENQQPGIAKKITYIPNGARTHEVMPLSYHADDFRAIYAGNLGLAQDNEILLLLAEKLKSREVKLTIMGYGYHSQHLKNEIKARNLDNVSFVHPVTRAECFEIIAAHQVGIVTLMDKEVFKTVLPGKIIDYMTCGLPIIGSVDGFSKDVIEANETGFVSKTKQAGELVGYVDKLLGDPLLQKRLSRNAQQYVKRNFLWENNIHSLTDIMEKQEERAASKLRKVEL
ncbi:glycosyltransferase family 4 protein [Halobacillus litoralis]|uniref:glycosyltransferase family 4 protein n=1 Tax=Halobacillus litoralis TaxID=45668 RepID=UPI001CD7FEC6|nr:glycosyltransferase family 4 protein [Halobacillus litoralis]MCA1021043.1 glycosyltransferase family 4 protein [Halobacillus litoralis]